MNYNLEFFVGGSAFAAPTAASLTHAAVCMQVSPWSQRLTLTMNVKPLWTAFLLALIIMDVVAESGDKWRNKKKKKKNRRKWKSKGKHDLVDGMKGQSTSEPHISSESVQNNKTPGREGASDLR